MVHLALTESINILVNVFRVLLEFTAKQTLTNARQILAQTVEFALILSMDSSVNAPEDTTMLDV